MTEGVKYDGEKPKMHLLPPKAIIEVAKVLTFGANKYDEENWKKLEDLQSRYTSGALRHIFAHMDGEDLDSESNVSHVAHAICCLLFKLEIELEQKSKEKRSRESVSFEHSTRYKAAPAHFYGAETYNQEGSMLDPEYIIQYEPPKYDNSGVLGEGTVRREEKSTKSRKGPKPK